MTLPTWIFPYLGAFIVGFGKAGFASGISMLQTPLLAYAMPARKAIGLVLPLLVVADIMTVSVYWKKWDLKLVVWPLITIATFPFSTSFGSRPFSARFAR